jgi:hypothetical protein
MSSLKLRPGIVSPSGCGTMWAWTMAAAIIMQQLCKKKDVPRVPRAFGFMKRVLEKKKHPQMKEMIEVRDFSHP